MEPKPVKPWPRVRRALCSVYGVNIARLLFTDGSRPMTSAATQLTVQSCDATAGCEARWERCRICETAMHQYPLTQRSGDSVSCLVNHTNYPPTSHPSQHTHTFLPSPRTPTHQKQLCHCHSTNVCLGCILRSEKVDIMGLSRLDEY